MQLSVDPNVFSEFQTKIAQHLRLPFTSANVLEEFVDMDVNAEGVSKVIERNQYYEYMLMQMVKSLRKKKEEEDHPGLQSSIVLMGMQGARNFICGLQMYRTVTEKMPELKEGKLDFKPSNYLKYALKAEEYITGRKRKYADTAYAAGLMFDLMALVGEELFEADKSFQDYLEEVFKHGLKAAKVALHLTDGIKNFGFSRFIFSACLIHDIGKVAMELLYPPNTANAYKQFRDDVTKTPLSREVIYFIEAKRYGLTHDYYSTRMAHNFRLFREVEPAILNHHHPYLIRYRNKDIYPLACVVALASNIANNFKIPTGPDDIVMKSWFTTEIKGFKVDFNQLLVAIKRAAAEG